MILTQRLLVFPVHRKSYRKYYDEQERYAVQERTNLENIWGRPFSSINKDLQIHIEARLWWPPWYFNDIIGFLEIGSERKGARLVGSLYVKRKYLLRNNPERCSRKHVSGLKKHEILYYGQTLDQDINLNDNNSYVEAAYKIIDEALRRIRKRFRGAEITLHPYNLNCINFIAADRQARLEHTL